MTAQAQLLSEHRCFGGTQTFYEHPSSVIGLPMRFSVFIPPQAQQGPVPAVMYLAGLTCNEETFMTKAGAQRLASELGLALIAPDTSPRGANVPGETDSWDLGVGMATTPPLRRMAAAASIWDCCSGFNMSRLLRSLSLGFEPGQPASMKATPS